MFALALCAAAIASSVMACYKPLTAYRHEGAIVFKAPHRLSPSMQLPCGRCIGCRIDRSRQWAVRCMHEASMHEENCFITLTYDNEHLPPGGTLVKKDFQKFIRALRQRTKKKIRYYMCGEYGEKLGRPHYHALLFGYQFPDRTLWEERKNNKFYRSKILEKTWTKGYSSISEITFDSAAYVARYVMKKITGDQASEHYERINEETGEIIKLLPEYNSMSLKPGIASEWYEEYKYDVFPSDRLILNGKRYRTPKYYDDQLKKAYPSAHELLKERRTQKAIEHQKRNTPERLKMHENIAKAKMNQFKRTLT